ncbi:MAG: outer membrane beta-barrel protein [Ignavibacterium sp.]|nr:outer membrane beta-barrel protein [Ignavibacterium sp.]
MKQLLSILLLAVLFTGFINAQSKMAFGLQAGVAIPLGDFGDGYDLGFGGQGTFAYHINPMFDVTGSVGYLTWSGKADGVTFSSVPVLVGVRYYFGQDKFNPYVSGELGMHFITSEFKEENSEISISSSDSFFGFGAGAGFLYKMGPNLDLDVNAKFNSISSEGSARNYIGIMAGVLIAL